MKQVMAVLLGMLLLIKGGAPNASADDAPQGIKIRFGIGIALLATEQCAGYRVGPAYEGLLGILRAGANAKGEQFDETAFLERCKKEATATLETAGKDLCTEVAQAAEQSKIIVRK